MLQIDKGVAKQTLEWLERMMDECGALDAQEKAELQTLINYWRLYTKF